MENKLINSIKIIKLSVVPIAYQEQDISGKFRVSIVGTGFVFSKEKEKILVCTCAHVVTQNKVIRTDAQLQVGIKTKEGYKGFPANVLSVDFDKDLTVLQIILSNNIDAYNCISEIQIGDSANLEEGQDIAFIGFPFGMSLSNDIAPSTTNGIISAFRKNVSSGEIEHVQLDAITSSGNSGAPVFSPGEDKVVAIIKGRFDPLTMGRPPRLIIDGQPLEIFTNIGFAQPVNIAKSFLLNALPKALPAEN